MKQDDKWQADAQQTAAAEQSTAEQAATAAGAGGGRGLLAAWAAWEPKKRAALVRLSLCLLLGLLLMLWARQPLARSLGLDGDGNVNSVNSVSNVSNVSNVNGDISDSGGSLNVNNSSYSDVATADALEQELASILSQVKGAGQARVAVWYAAGESAVYAHQSQTAHSQSLSNDGGSTASTVEESLSPAVVGEGPLLLRQEAAVVQGVLVVAPGAGDAAVRERIYSALQGLLGLDMAQIAVIEAAQ